MASLWAFVTYSSSSSEAYPYTQLVLGLAL